MNFKTVLLLLACVFLFVPVASAEIQPIVWSETLRIEKKPTTELLNISGYMVVKSDRTVSINLSERFPVTAIDLKPDINRQDSYINKKDFLFTLRLSDTLPKYMQIPFGEHKL